MFFLYILFECLFAGGERELNFGSSFRSHQKARVYARFQHNGHEKKERRKISVRNFYVNSLILQKNVPIMNSEFNKKMS